MRQCVLLTGVERETVFAGTCRVDEFNFNILADAFQMAIPPQLPRIRRSRPAALFCGAVIRASGRMRIDLIGRTPDDVDATAVGLAAGDAGGKVLVGVGETPVMLIPNGIDH